MTDRFKATQKQLDGNEHEAFRLGYESALKDCLDILGSGYFLDNNIKNTIKELIKEL